MEASHEPSPSNTPAPHSLDAIYLDDNDDSLAGGHKTMHLASGKEITHLNVTPVPMTEEVVKRIEALAKKDGISAKLSFIFRHRGKFITDLDALLAGVDGENQNQNQKSK